MVNRRPLWKRLLHRIAGRPRIKPTGHLPAMTVIGKRALRIAIANMSR